MSIKDREEAVHNVMNQMASVQQKSQAFVERIIKPGSLTQNQIMLLIQLRRVAFFNDSESITHPLGIAPENNAIYKPMVGLYNKDISSINLLNDYGGITLKQEERREQTIGQLLNATKELLRDSGCHGITMKDIMEKSELSKGAIFHYVKSKDEIFAWVLQERLEETNKHFMNEVIQAPAAFDGPMQVISSNLAELEDADDVTNKVLMYLLGKEDEPVVAEVLKNYYERSVYLSKQWIVSGQQHGVILESVDPDKTAEMFVLLSLGLRVRSSFPIKTTSVTAQDISAYMAGILKDQ